MKGEFVSLDRSGCRHARTPSHNFAVSKSLTRSLPWAAWHSKGGLTDSHYARTPARARHGPSGGVGSCSKRSRTAFASQSRCWEYLSVYELTHRAPGSRRAVGSRKHSSGMPRICWRTIFICGKPQRYDKPLKQLGLLSRQADIRRVTGASSVNLRQAVGRLERRPGRSSR